MGGLGGGGGSAGALEVVAVRALARMEMVGEAGLARVMVGVEMAVVVDTAMAMAVAAAVW